MKKGISLIVLVITIIVMIVIAGAIILALNSSNVTNKASWAQISADRANLQSEYATILADVVARQKVGEDYIGVTLGDVKGIVENDAGETDTIAATNYTTWSDKVENTNKRFAIAEPEDTKPAALKVVMYITAEEAEAFGLTTDGAKVVGYDWVKISTKDNSVGAISLSAFDAIQ